MEILDRIDWVSVNWLYVAVLTALVFFSTLIGALLSFKRAFRTAVLSALLFALGVVFWTYYPHGLPLPTSVSAQKAPDSLRPQSGLVGLMVIVVLLSSTRSASHAALVKCAFL